jgi:thiamine biosynthesis lipoprotein
MRHVFATMGTMVSLDTADSAVSADLMAKVEAEFSAIDETFSLYRPDSELSRVASGQLALTASSAELRAQYAEALLWRNSTNGAFSPHRPDGVIDLNGIVKAIAIDRAGAVLDRAGIPRWCLDVGGDILVRDPASAPWLLGIADPDARQALLCAVTVSGQRRALATSGSAERGDHIWSNVNAEAPAFRQVTVMAEDIVTADVLATAIVAGGRPALDDFTARFRIDVLTLDAAGELAATPGLVAALAG